MHAEGTLEARVARLEAEAGVVRALHRYGHAIDAGDEAAWVDGFTTAGEFQVGGAGSGGAYTIAGHDQLRAFAARHSRRPEGLHEHVTVLPVIELADDLVHASCRSRFFVIVMDGPRPVIRAFGTYYDELERGSDGVWRFVVRRPEVDAAAPDLPPLAFSHTPTDRPFV